MPALSPDVTAALTTLRTRWGTAAPARFGESVGGVVGALATVPLEVPGIEPEVDRRRSDRADSSSIFSTGFAALDKILGPGGLPRGMGLSVRGDVSSGRTTLALRLAAEAQAAGAIVAWLDLAAAFDPVEAVARGIDPEWFVVVTPADLDEGLAIAGALLSGRTVDLLVIDVPGRLSARPVAGSAGARSRTSGSLADRLGRLAALARRAGISLVVLEPPDLSSGLSGAIGEATGLRLELARRSWIRLGRDVIGQRTEVVVVRNRAGPPGRRATLRILYAEGGERDACLRRDELLSEAPTSLPALAPAPAIAPIPVPGTRTDATPPPLSTTSPPRPCEPAPALRLVSAGRAATVAGLAGRPGREALDRRDGPRRRPGGSSPRRAAWDAPRGGASPGPRGGLPRSRAGG